MTPTLEEHDYIGLSEVSSNGSSTISSDSDNLKQTELRLGLPGSESPERVNGSALTLAINLKGFGSGSKRVFSDAINGSPKWVFGGNNSGSEAKDGGAKDGEKKPAAKAQVVGWPPIRNSRKNLMVANTSKNKEDADGKQSSGCLYVKVSMDGAPYLRKVDLKTYSNYKELSLALEKMFSCFTIGQCGSHGIPTKDKLTESRKADLIDGSENVLTYEDKDGDWMLVGDVPWDMFTETCRRLRIMKGSDAIGLAPRVGEKSKNRN
uniref:Auxin-responsive protein n=2 Tax=Lycoris longituba TaxID=272140 RepID=D6MKQ0_9ASPA